MRVVSLSVLLVGASFLAGCVSIPPPDEVEVECDFGMENCKVRGKWTTSNGKFQNLGLLLGENVSMDFGQSLNTLTNNPVKTANIVLKSNGASIAMMPTTYNQVGDEIVAAHDAAVVNWLSSYDGQADEIIMTVENLDFVPEIGINFVAVEIKHDNAVLAGASTSAYLTEADYECVTNPDGFLSTSQSFCGSGGGPGGI